MGTPEFAIPSLEAIAKNYTLIAVITAPDKPAGRGHKLVQSPVKLWALEHNVCLLQPANLKSKQLMNMLRELKPDLFVVVAFRMLPFDLLNLPAMGSINVHASLLPKYRGAAPIQRAIMAGEKETGITVFKLASQIDTGQIISQKVVPIGPDMTGGELHDILKLEGSTVLLEALHVLEEQKEIYTIQEESFATHAPKIFREDCQIDFSKDVQEVYNQIRALIPYPCSWFIFKNRTFKIFEARCIIENHSQVVGSLFTIGSKLCLACKNGYIQVFLIQEEGKRVLNATEFINGAKVRGLI